MAVLGNRQRSLERPRYAGGSSIGYTRVSCFSELLGLPGPSPHQSLAVRVHVPVELSPSPTVHDVPVESLSMPIARQADPAFEERWAAWRARRLRHERAVQRRLRVVGLVIAVVVGLVTLGLRLLRDSS